jgi:uncharacterized membrane protein SirB2
MEAGTLAAIIKHIHVWLVVLSIGGFAIRYVLTQQQGHYRPRRKLVRIAPHVVDALLLISGFSLAGLYRLSVFEADWLAAKLVLIVIYIVLGVLAMRPALSRSVRRIAGMAAFASAFTIIFLAVYKPDLF